MTPNDPLETVLNQLSQGNAEAAERVFRMYEPMLRMMVRRNLSPPLRTKFDSIDIVQSVWGDLLQGFRSGRWQFDTPEQLRAFLMRATRNRLIDRVRGEQNALDRELRWDREHLDRLLSDDLAPVDADLHAEELWQRLLELCPPQHRPLLELKRQGLPLAEIAARTQLHASSVRRILYELADRFAASEPPAANE